MSEQHGPEDLLRLDGHGAGWHTGREHHVVHVPAGETRIISLPHGPTVTIRTDPLPSLPRAPDPRAHRAAIWWGALIGALSSYVIGSTLYPDDGELAVIAIAAILGVLVLTGLVKVIDRLVVR
jgi:hypothetical protein